MVKNGNNQTTVLRGKCLMKKFCISFLIICIIILSAIGFITTKPPKTTEYLRIHVRANSNEYQEQQVKYAVKDAVVTFLTPYIAECDTKKKAQTLLTDNLSKIKSVADSVLKENGFTYFSSVGVEREKFPTRVYQGVTLESGYYDALIINLGSGTGDNWWCVVYPPLCFTESGLSGYVYRSKILDIINDFFNKEKN